MSAMEPLYRLTGIPLSQLTEKQGLFLDAVIFTHICKELREIFRKQHIEYFRLMKFTPEKENHMLESEFIRLIIKDILKTGDYTLEGIAYYTDTHEDVIRELAAGLNTKPTALFFRKTIELHRTVRRELYSTIARKIASEYSDVA